MRLIVAAFGVFDIAFFQGAVADDDAVRDAEKLGVVQQYACAFVAVVEEDVCACRQQFGVDFVGGFANGV